MNKKVVLSVLSATVVASMAASAFAAPKSGLYIGGNVDKFYSFDTLFDITPGALTQFTNEIGLSDFNNLIYVDFDGKGASLQEIMAATDFNSVKKDLTSDKFEGEYSLVKPDGTSSEKYDPRKDSIDTPAGELKVESVSAINGTQVEVKFNKAVDPESLFADGVSGAFAGTATVSLTTIDTVPSGTLTGELSEDGKTLVITASNALSKRYKAIIDGLKAVDGASIAAYDEVVTFAADTTAPTILSTVKTSASTFTVTFSEPVSTIGTVSYKYADGTPVTAGYVTDDFAGTTKTVTFTLGSNIAAGKTVVATFIGVQDTAGNLLTPNPATATFVKGSMDGVAPTVSAITQTGAKTFSVKFSEQLAAKPTIAINGTPVATSSVVKSSTDATVYNVTAPSVLDGATTVEVSSFSDLSGEVGTTTSKVVVFVKDIDAPKVTSSNVVTDTTDGKQYLEITFDKDVTLGGTPTVDGEGSYVKDYVTTPLATGALPTTAVAYKNTSNKKVVRVELDSFLGTTTDVEGATYTLDLTFTQVDSAAAVPAATAKVTFTRGKDTVPASQVVAHVTNVTPGADNNKVEVTFDTAVDGASATNVNNYKIDGAIVESVTLKPVSGGTQVAVLNLKAGSNTFTGARNINISGVKALGSTKVMEPFFTNTVVLKENVAPVVTSAKLTATDKITLTFSEGVSQAVLTNDDFEVLVGGKSQATQETVDTGLTSTAATTVVVTINAVDAPKLAQGLSLKALTTLDVKDAAGNVLSVPANITVTQ